MDKPEALFESIRFAGPNVYALVALAGGVFAFRWVAGKLVYRPVRRV